MADLTIDDAMLERVTENVTNIEDLLNGPARIMRSVDASGVGPSTLEDRVRDFGKDRRCDIDRLGEFSGSVIDSLQAIADAFDEADAIVRPVGSGTSENAE